MSGLQIDEHLGYHRAFWRIQHVAWGLLVLVLVATGLGLLGGQGPLHSATIGSRASLEVRHPRVQRLGSEIRLDFRLAPGSEPTVLVFPSSFFLNHRVQAWTPEPETTRVIGDRTRFEFGRADRVVLHAAVLTVGRKSVTVRTGSGGGVQIDYLVLP